MTLLTRDEEDIVEANLLYHLDRGVDFVIAMDNGSEDGTLEVLEAYERQGVLHLLRDRSRAQDHRRWRTTMARMAATDFAADWVINNDADEFWWPWEGTLKEALEDVPARFGVVTAPRVNFAPGQIDEGFFADRMSTRWVDARRPKVAHRAGSDVVVNVGGHYIESGAASPLGGWYPIQVLHYPTRGPRQWERKLRQTLSAKREAGLEPRQYPGQYRLLEAGRAAEGYAQLALHGDRLERALGQGRAIDDPRMSAFLAGLHARFMFPQLAGLPHEPGRAVDDPDWPEREQRRARMLASIGQHEQEVLLVRRSLERRLSKAEKRLLKVRRRKREDRAATASARKRSASPISRAARRLAATGRTRARNLRRL